MTEPRRIVVPVDGSAAANRAVAHAISLVADRTEAEIVLLNAQNLQTLDISDISGVMTIEVDRRLAARQSRIALRKAIDLCRKAKVSFVTRAEIGSPAETIDRVAREVGAAQIVMGTRGLGRLGNLFLGSVATQVVRVAQVPVTLVK
ncbi:MAG: universal stress protein [Stellaceae bacterium]|jgi:nucleotide-binding universal stress UspA family protein